MCKKDSVELDKTVWMRRAVRLLQLSITTIGFIVLVSTIAVGDEPGLWEKSVIRTSNEIQQIPYDNRIIFRSSLISSSVLVYDSPDVPIVSGSNITQSENSVFIDPYNPLLLFIHVLIDQFD